MLKDGYNRKGFAGAANVISVHGFDFDVWSVNRVSIMVAVLLTCDVLTRVAKHVANYKARR